MYIVSPLSRCASAEKRDTFIHHISQIASVTYPSEPECHGYAWFVSAEDNDAIPHIWVRGFEVYKSAEANTVAHRASDEYKAFRKAVGEQSLLEKPSDLRFWHPMNIGFLTKEQQVNFASPETTGGRQYVIVDELQPKAGAKADVLSRLESLAAKFKGEDKVLTFWVLDRGAAQEGTNSVDGDDIYVLSRFQNKSSYRSLQESFGDAGWNEIGNLCEKRLTTTWVEAGLGFLGR